MRNILIGCALLAGIGTAVPMQAAAQDLEFEIGRDGLRIERGCNPRYEDCYRGERRGYYDDYRPRCSEGRALRKAERMGIRRARICEDGMPDVSIEYQVAPGVFSRASDDQRLDNAHFRDRLGDPSVPNRLLNGRRYRPEREQRCQGQYRNPTLKCNPDRVLHGLLLCETDAGGQRTGHCQHAFSTKQCDEVVVGEKAAQSVHHED